MTPDEARRLLEGTTPGPWEAYDPGDGTARLYGADNNRLIEHVTHGGAGSYMSQPNGVLAAAAPVLAATIAGMREEWIGQYLEREGKWATICAYPTREEVAHHLDHGSWDAYTHTRIVRRYVTEPEEA